MKECNHATTIRLQEGVFQTMAQLEAAVRRSGLEQPLLELVRMRASQLNACA
jgi:alkylhydroperoxidase family enzyme